MVAQPTHLHWVLQNGSKQFTGEETMNGLVLHLVVSAQSCGRQGLGVILEQEEERDRQSPGGGRVALLC